MEEQLYVAIDAAEQQVAGATAVLAGAPGVDDVTALVVSVHGQTNGGAC